MPNNPHVRARLNAIVKQLQAAYSGGETMTSATKGTEREMFIEIFLKNVLPPAYRFGTGDITDTMGGRSGQIDVVVEHWSIPSFPLVGASIPRLYLAEGVGAAIEVKSDLAAQWTKVVKTAQAVSTLSRGNLGHVPFFVVGYQGWQNVATLEQNVREANSEGANIVGALTLDPSHYSGVISKQVTTFVTPDIDLPDLPAIPEVGWEWQSLQAEGDMGLLALLDALHAAMTRVMYVPDILQRYLSIVSANPPA